MNIDNQSSVFEVDFTADELRRRAHVMEALGDDWDPVAVLQNEDQACTRLYSGLDDHQQETYDELVRAGVLRGRGADRDAA
jgi:hypothetical protein